MSCAAVALRFPPPALAPTFDQAVSASAVDLRETIQLALASGASLAPNRSEQIQTGLMEAIGRAAVEQDVWVTPEAYERALAFLSAVPSDIPVPAVVPEVDGEIGLDWDEGSRRVLSVSVGTGPMLGYAALIGAEPTCGRVAFAGTLPETLAYILRRIYSEPAAD